MPFDGMLEIKYDLNKLFKYMEKKYDFDKIVTVGKSLKKLYDALPSSSDEDSYPIKLLLQDDINEALDVLYEFLSSIDKKHYHFRELNDENIYKFFNLGFGKKNPTQSDIYKGIDCLKNFIERNDDWRWITGGRYGPPDVDNWEEHMAGIMFSVERDTGYVFESSLKDTIDNLFDCKIKSEYKLLMEIL